MVRTSVALVPTVARFVVVSHGYVSGRYSIDVAAVVNARKNRRTSLAVVDMLL